MGGNIGLIELGLIFGLVLCVIGYQIWATRRSITRDRKARDRAASDDRAPQP